MTFSAAGLDGPSSRTIAVQVTDDGGLTATGRRRVDVENVAPTATVHRRGAGVRRPSVHLSLTGASDPSAADTAAGFTYAFDCGGGYGAFGAAASTACTPTVVGPLSVGGKIRDKDGGDSEYRARRPGDGRRTRASAQLVGAYSSDTQTTEILCGKLDQARAAATDTARAGLLNAFRNQVDARTGTEPGKAFTADEGATLIRLSRRL